MSWSMGAVRNWSQSVRVVHFPLIFVVYPLIPFLMTRMKKSKTNHIKDSLRQSTNRFSYFLLIRTREDSFVKQRKNDWDISAKEILDKKNLLIFSTISSSNNWTWLFSFIDLFLLDRVFKSEYYPRRSLTFIDDRKAKTS